MKETSTNKAITNNDAVGATTSVMPDRDKRRKTTKVIAILATATILLGALVLPLARVDAMANANANANAFGSNTPNANANANAFKDRSDRLDHVKDIVQEARDRAEQAPPANPANEAGNVSDNARNQQSNSTSVDRSERTTGTDKVTICHRTNSVTNPYRVITISVSAIDGQGGSDHSQHAGPVAYSEEVARELKSEQTKWGDIIPPVEGVNSGQNWNDEGQAVFENDCTYPTATTDDNDGEVLGDDDKQEAGKGGVPADETDEGETLSAAATADTPDALPKTGAASALAFLVSALSGIATGVYTWMRGRKEAVQTTMARVKNDR